MAEKHVHKFKRHHYKTGNRVFFCTLPDCNFKIEVALSLGKSNICNRCGETFSINEYSIRMAKPHCNNCIVRKGNTRVTNTVRDDRATANNAITTLRDRLDKAVTEYPEITDEDL